MTVELICVGTELLLGNIVNTNAAYLAEKCASLGLCCYYQSVVGDNEDRMEATIRLALSRSDIVILTGGLGPTADDLTKEVTAKIFGKKLAEDKHTKERIQIYFQRMQKKDITENNWKQAIIPENAIVIDNNNGTAPGLILKEGTKTAVLLPGPPNELKPMFENDIIPYLRGLEQEGIYSRTIKICSLGESKVADALSDLMRDQTNPTIAPYAKTGEVHLRITARAFDEAAADRLMAPITEEVFKRLGAYIYSTEERMTLEDTVVYLLKKHKMTVTTAESCTGGLLAGRIMNVPGASAVYNEGYITYSNEAKEKLLGVHHESLEKFGAVSPAVAEEMARGAAKAAGSDTALSVTGIAGPDGGTQEKPVGLIYIGCYCNGTVRVEKFHFTGNRAKNREYAVARALTILWEEIVKMESR